MGGTQAAAPRRHSAPARIWISTNSQGGWHQFGALICEPGGWLPVRQQSEERDRDIFGELNTCADKPALRSHMGTAQLGGWHPRRAPKTGTQDGEKGIRGRQPKRWWQGFLHMCGSRDGGWHRFLAGCDGCDGCDGCNGCNGCDAGVVFLYGNHAAYVAVLVAILRYPQRIPSR